MCVCVCAYTQFTRIMYLFLRLAVPPSVSCPSLSRLRSSLAIPASVMSRLNVLIHAGPAALRLFLKAALISPCFPTRNGTPRLHSTPSHLSLSLSLSSIHSSTGRPAVARIVPRSFVLFLVRSFSRISIHFPIDLKRSYSLRVALPSLMQALNFHRRSPGLGHYFSPSLGP